MDEVRGGDCIIIRRDQVWGAIETCHSFRKFVLVGKLMSKSGIPENHDYFSD